MQWSPFDGYGRRKYVNRTEVLRFIEAAAAEPPEVALFCRLLAETGCRISEALALSANRVDAEDGLVVFESLKKRRSGVFRAVPVSAELTRALHALPIPVAGGRIWRWSRMTAWRHVSRVCAAARIVGPHATPKGFRHGFAVGALGAGVPLNMVQRWLGHADLQTTAIYANAAGPEERALADRLRRHYLADDAAPAAIRGSTRAIALPDWPEDAELIEIIDDMA